MNSSEARQIAAAAKKALVEALSNHGAVTCSVDRITYSSNGHIRFAVVIHPVGETPEAAAYKSQCGIYGCKPEWLGEEFDFDGERCKVVGLRPRARKFQIVIQSVNTRQRLVIPAAALRHYATTSKPCSNGTTAS